MQGIVHTAAFEQWFGKSKLMCDDGMPRVLYHGTTSSFLGFSPKKRNPDLGFHFGSIAQSEFFAGHGDGGGTSSGGNLIPVYLRIENPLRMPDIFTRGRRGSESVADWLLARGVIDMAEHFRVYAAKCARVAYARIIAVIEAAGFDGIVYENEHEGGTATTNEDSYIAFRPEQIRSVFDAGTSGYFARS